MHLCGVPGQQQTAVAVGGGLSRHVGEPGDPGGAAEPEVRSVHGDECLAKLVHGRVAGVFDGSFSEDDPDLARFPPTDGVGAGAVDILTGAPFDDDDVDPRQRQLARQHQPGRPASCDHHRMFGHRRSPANPVVNGGEGR